MLNVKILKTQIQKIQRPRLEQNRYFINPSRGNSSFTSPNCFKILQSHLNLPQHPVWAISSMSQYTAAGKKKEKKENISLSSHGYVPALHLLLHLPSPVLLLQPEHLSRWRWSYWGMTDSLPSPSNQSPRQSGALFIVCNEALPAAPLNRAHC